MNIEINKYLKVRGKKRTCFITGTLQLLLLNRKKIFIAIRKKNLKLEAKSDYV